MGLLAGCGGHVLPYNGLKEASQMSRSSQEYNCCILERVIEHKEFAARHRYGERDSQGSAHGDVEIFAAGQTTTGRRSDLLHCQK
jgi:hypothetical protein